MTRIELVSLSLSHFMGVRSFELRLDGRDATVRATNGAGKTTLATAFSWLLTGKDSRGQADFEVKTLDAAGEALHNLEHTVEATLRVGAEEITLRRAFVEIWTKKRGAAREEFTGHETKFWIDGVPMGTKKEFDERVAELVPATAWRELTNPDAWHAQHWQKRRADLIEICGDVTDAELIAANKELADLPTILGKRTPDAHRKVIESRRREINSELKTVPARIDEVRIGLPARPELSLARVTSGLAAAREAHQAALADLAAARAGQGDASAERKRLREVEDALTDLERQARRKNDEAADKARGNVQDAKRALEDAKERLVRWERQASELQGDVERLDAQLAELRERWAVVNARKIDPHVDGTCVACHQALPAEQVEEAHAAAVADLNGRKARELAQITDDGKSLKAKRDTLAAELAMLLDKTRNQTTGLASLQADVDKAMEGLTKAEATQTDATASKEYTRLAAERDDLTRRIEQVTAGDPTALTALEERVQAAQAAVSLLEHDAAAYDAISRSEARLSQLKDQEQLLAREHETLERELHVIEEFVRAKSRMLTNRINNHFQLTEFRLFEEQLNGGLADACVATVAGVPYGSGLNRAARINSGLDVIGVLQAHHGVAVPVFVDECESVVNLLPLPTQVVRLVVDEHHAQLHVELTPQKEQVAA